MLKNLFCINNLIPQRWQTVVERSLHERKVVGSIPDRLIPKDVIRGEMEPDAFLLIAKAYKVSFDFSLLSNLLKMMDSTWNERSRVINIR